MAAPTLRLPSKWVAGILAGLGLLAVLAAVNLFGDDRDVAESGAQSEPAVETGSEDGDAPAPGTTTDAGETTEGATEPAPTGTEAGDPAPTTGSLRNEIRKTVGPFKLTGVRRDEEMVTKYGYRDFYWANYSGPGGVKILAYFAALESSAKAEKDARAYATYLVQKDGYQQLEEWVVKNGGRRIGVGFHLRKGDDYVLWSNGRLSLSASGPKGEPTKFYNESPI